MTSAPKPILLSRSLVALADRVDADATAWSEAQRLLEETGETDPDLVAAIQAKDTAALQSILTAWENGKRPLPEHDRTVLKHAMKAFRKSLKLTRLDAESKIGGGPMSKGRESGIVGMAPPAHYPREIWEELVRQGRLLRERHGMYELPPE